MCGSGDDLLQLLVNHRRCRGHTRTHLRVGGRCRCFAERGGRGVAGVGGGIAAVTVRAVAARTAAFTPVAAIAVAAAFFAGRPVGGWRCVAIRSIAGASVDFVALRRRMATTKRGGCLRGQWRCVGCRC